EVGKHNCKLAAFGRRRTRRRGRGCADALGCRRGADAALGAEPLLRWILSAASRTKPRQRRSAIATKSPAGPDVRPASRAIHAFPFSKDRAPLFARHAVEAITKTQEVRSSNAYGRENRLQKGGPSVTVVTPTGRLARIGFSIVLMFWIYL